MLPKPLSQLSADQRALLRPARANAGFAPMKAVLTDRGFSDPEWIFEPKLDGVRVIAYRDGGRVRLMSRTGKEQNPSYPELVEALGRQDPGDFVVDGEIVAFDRGLPSFERLQGRMQIKDPERARRTGIAVHLYLFDLLGLDGQDTRNLPLRTRKEILRQTLSFDEPLHFTSHRNERGEEFFREACRRGWEGLIAKRADSPYVGKRSRDWLKLKCSHQQELVIGGFTAPQGSRTEFGALLVGYYEGGGLRYAGKVGTGFNQRTLKELGRRLRSLERDSPPFVDVHPIPKGTRWVEPELVAQIAFGEWTRDGRLRHPRYLGLRDDKPATEVVREEPAG
jgi:bifunctional non-homologous end joining protein LigD